MTTRFEENSLCIHGISNLYQYNNIISLGKFKTISSAIRHVFGLHREY